MNHSSEYLRCLREIDVAAIRKLWAHTNPHLHQGMTDAEVVTAIHLARTMTKSLALKYRAYSHRWLLDHGYPSHLPDELRPKAEQLCPRKVSAVGISVNVSALELKPAAKFIQDRIADAIEGAYADGVKDPEIIRPIMADARDKAKNYVFGRFTTHWPVKAGGA